MGKSGDNEPGAGPPSSRARDTQIFICDASAEAGRLLTGLHARGYAVVDVPLGLLPGRVNYEIPKVVVCDADAAEAKVRLAEMLEAAGEPICIALLATPHGAIAHDPELRKMAQVVIPRPVDIDTAIEKIGRPAGSPSTGSHRPRIGLHSRSPVLVASARKPYRSDGYGAKINSSRPPDGGADHDELLWPTEAALNRGPLALDSSRFAYESGGASAPSLTTSSPPSSGQLSLSPETRMVLDEGRKKVKTYSHQSSPRPIRLTASAQTEGGEIREEFLSALKENLGDADPGEDAELKSLEDTSGGGTNAGGRMSNATTPEQRAATQTGATKLDGGTAPGRSSRPKLDDDDEPTNPGGRPPTQPPGPLLEDHDYFPRADVPPALDDLSDLLNAKSSRPPPSLPAVSIQTERPGAFDREPLPSQLLATVPPPSHPENPDRIRNPISISPLPLSQPAPSLPASLAPQPLTFPEATPRMTEQANFESAWKKEAALYSLARAIQERRSGAVAQQDGVGLRRIVLTDGDISTVTSTLSDESLSHFLAARGDITEEVLHSLGSIPRFGRHAGAALVARGLLQQEDLWPVLRSHAEWILGRALLSEEPTEIEETVPARILEEPAVFGGAAGTEIYLETVRRVVGAEEAFRLLGSGERILSLGRHESLLGESALTATEQHHVMSIVGKSLTRLKQQHPDLLSVVLGLTYLGVFSTGGEAPARPSEPKENLKVRSSEIDDEAFVTRVMSRRALIDDGDYFSILGIPRSATSYEIDRARDELLAEYADHRLTARTVHLQKDLELLRETIDEAHLVLRDDVRRMRYRAALEAMPN